MAICNIGAAQVSSSVTSVCVSSSIWDLGLGMWVWALGFQGLECRADIAEIQSKAHLGDRWEAIFLDPYEISRPGCSIVELSRAVSRTGATRVDR